LQVFTFFVEIFPVLPDSVPTAFKADSLTDKKSIMPLWLGRAQTKGAGFDENPALDLCQPIT